MFNAQTSKGAHLVAAGVAGGVADQIGPDLIGGMPGLPTGIIVGAPGQPFYVSNLGDALVRVEKNSLIVQSVWATTGPPMAETCLD